MKQINKINIKEYVAGEKAALKDELIEFQEDNCWHEVGYAPRLAIIQIGDNDASNRYVAGKMRDLKEVGMIGRVYKFDEDDLSQDELEWFIEDLNMDEDISGIIVQLPLPDKYDVSRVKRAIAPAKDADGFHPLSVVDPATPAGIVEYLEACGYDFDGKNAVILGRSDIVGRPMAKLLLDRNMNVVVLHSHTGAEDRAFYLEHADLVICAVGKAGTISKADKLKKSAWIIDVGINRDAESGRLVGDCEEGLDVDYQSCVPGGVGLLTRLQLSKNLAKLYEDENRIPERQYDYGDDDGVCISDYDCGDDGDDEEEDEDNE